MSSNKGKSDDNLKDKIKNLFRRNKDTVSLTKGPSRELTTILSPEILKDIGPESPGNNRIKTIKELADAVHKKKLEPNAIEALWCAIQDLFLPQTVSEKRHVALNFLRCLLEGQKDNLGLLRSHFFHVIQSLTHLENMEERLELFAILSDNGKSLLDFEEEAGPFLLMIMPDVIQIGKAGHLLPLLISIVKFNAAYLDEDVVSGFVKQTCVICNRRSSDDQKNDNEIQLSLDVLAAVLSYSYLPSDVLKDVISALCRMVNVRKFCEPSWMLMRKLLGTHLGHSCIYTMCNMLQVEEKPVDDSLLRGAIFYIGMALWGSKKVKDLKHSPAAVLPSFLHALDLDSPKIHYEVMLSTQRLVKKYGKELPHATWEIILDLLDSVYKHLNTAKDLSAHPQTPVELHDTLSSIEQLYEHGNYSGPVDRFFRIIEKCAAKRPENSVILLITYLALDIHPEKENWIKNLYLLLEKYFRMDRRKQVRQKVLEVLSFIISINKHLYEDDLINCIILPLMCHVDEDVSIREIMVQILIDLAQTCSPHNFLDIINIVEKIMSCKQHIYLTSENSEIVVESSFRVVKSTVRLLVDLFCDKLYRSPPGVCIKLYDVLVTHLSNQIDSLAEFRSFAAGAVRKAIVECLLNLRADASMRVGISTKPLKFSPFVVCDWNDSQVSPPASPVSTTQPSSSQWCNNTHLYYNKSFSIFIRLLEHEKDWEVLKCVLERLPVLLQNKTIVLSKDKMLVDTLCSRLCAMINDRNLRLPEQLTGLPDKFTKSNFHEYVFPVLASLVNYHNYLDRQKQIELIKCLEFGMVSKVAKSCVNALRLCTLEMQDTMMRLLPSVLLQLSKISATITMAIPVLAFLSSIVRLPNMYANFVEEEYMSVFAIALPYTNPFKFSHYTVSLAHHVIAIWFIRCRQPFRKGFVQFIHKGLKQNVLQQFEENARIALQNQNQDSSDRVRSGSYSEAALRSRRRMQSGSAVSRSEVNAPVDEKLSQFHRELTETCTDVMARYTFGNFSPIPHRSHMAEFLLAGGQYQTWLVGNKLITITTSGSGNKLGNSGVCEKCVAAYQAVEQKDHKTGRRRHKSAKVVRENSMTMVPQQKLAQDDLTLKHRKSVDDLDLDMLGKNVAVQTGSSLNENAGTADNELLESLFLGNMKTSDPQMPIHICNCWCTNWAEIHIRAPSGNLSWMMRTENETGQHSVQDSQVQDITMIFASIGKKRRADSDRRSHRIESGSIGEEEYETLYKQHFENNIKHENIMNAIPKTELPQIAEVDNSQIMDRPGSLGFTASSVTEETNVDTHEVSDALFIPSNESARNHDITPGSIRRSNSSPSVLSGSSDTLSPRDSISDVVQFGPLPKSEKRVSVPKSSDSDKSDIDLKMLEGQGQASSEQKEVDSHKTVKFDITPADENDGTQMSKSVNTTKVTDASANNVQSDSNKNMNVPKEYTSMLTRQLSPSPASSEASSTPEEVGELPASLKRPRGHTVAGTQLSGLSDTSSSLKSQSSKPMSGDSKVGVSPSFVFLQLYHNGQIQVNDTPLLLPNNEATERAIKMLDYICPYETHKIGVIYVGSGQTKDEKAILSNTYGSDRYVRFIQSLGRLIRLKDCNPRRVYLGGLETKGTDGEFTYGWQDESTQLIFHIATLMPNKEGDPNCNAKKLHIGNDYVTVVYNDSDEDYKIGVIKGQFNYVNIVIKPLDHGSNAVTLQAKEVPFQDQITTDIAGILGHTDTKVISDANLSALVRQIAIHCNLASMVLQRQASHSNDPFANNWLERLRQIKRMKDIAVLGTDPNKRTEDFTSYV
ncbi:Tuberous sclerosis 2-like protein [Mactra antiquata]